MRLPVTNIVCHIDSRGVQCRHAPSCALHLKHELNCNSTPKAGANRRPGPMYDPDFNDDDEAGPSTATLLQQSCAAMLLECAAAQNNLRAQILFPKKQRPCQGWQRGGRPFLCLRHAASEPQPRFLRRNDAMRADVEQLRAQLREATARETALQARPARPPRPSPRATPRPAVHHPHARATLARRLRAVQSNIGKSLTKLQKSNKPTNDFFICFCFT